MEKTITFALDPNNKMLNSTKAIVSFGWPNSVWDAKAKKHVEAPGYFYQVDFFVTKEEEGKEPVDEQMGSMRLFFKDGRDDSRIADALLQEYEVTVTSVIG